MNFGLFLLRLIVGGIFVAHGYPKLFGGPGKTVPPEASRYLGQGFVSAVENGGTTNVANYLRSMDIPEPERMAWVVGGAEFFGGILLIIGRLVRLASLALAVDMVVAIRKVHWQNGLIAPGGYEFPLSLLASCLALFFAGSGKRSA